MSLANTAVSALGKLVMLGVMLAVFAGGMVGVIYLALQGEEIKVPEITGKNFAESETELAALGLKIKKRADRVTNDPPNTIIEQLPKAGETVKTGQVIRVVISSGGTGGEAAPLPKGIAGSDDDAETIKEMISDKPKKAKANTNTNKKKADTSRDVNAAGASNVAAGNSNSKSNSSSGADKSNKSTPSTNTKPPASGDSKAPAEPKSRANRP